MQLENILPFAHSLLKQALKPDARALDGTAGNGNDTLMLARSIGSGGKVWAFDVQEQALANTRMRLEEAGMADRAELILDGHENLAAHIREPLDAAVFNFGWLPGGDKSCTTKAATSIRALTSALSLLKTGGLAVAVLYPGHEAGLYEAQAIEDWAQQLQQDEFAVLRYGFINRRNRPPYLLAFEKLRQECMFGVE